MRRSHTDRGPSTEVPPVETSVEDDLRDRIAALETEASQKDARIEERDAQVADIRAQVDEIRAQLDERDAVLARLQQRMDAAPDTQPAFPGIPDVERFAAQIEADRLLLVEMRKELPVDRSEAVAYWNNVKGLAAISDTSLVGKANIVITALPAYFNYLETDFTTQQDAILTFQLTGASDYEDATDDFWRAFALSLIDRLTIVSDKRRAIKTSSRSPACGPVEPNHSSTSHPKEQRDAARPPDSPAPPAAHSHAGPSRGRRRRGGRPNPLGRCADRAGTRDVRRTRLHLPARRQSLAHLQAGGGMGSGDRARGPRS